MKQGIHPVWYNCAVTCSCGNEFVIGSVNESLHVDICNKCHPFFTGEMRFVDRQGRVDRFMKKMQAAQTVAQTKQQARQAKNQAKTSQSGVDSQSYKDILRDQQSTLRKEAKAAKATA